MSIDDTNSPEFKMRYACMAGRIDAMRMYLDAGVDIDCTDDERRLSFLSDAAHNEQLDAVKFLLEAGANPDLGDPLGDALQKNNFAMADLLVSAGACINVVSRGRLRLSKPAFWRAVTPEMARWLIEKGIDFTQAIEGGRSALARLRKDHGRGRLDHPEILNLIEASIAENT